MSEFLHVHQMEAMKFAWENRRKELPSALDGNLYVSQEDLTTTFSRSSIMPPRRSAIVRINAPKSRGAQEIFNFAEHDITLRSVLGQLGVNLKLLGIDSGELYAELQNHGDDTFKWEAGQNLALGKAVALGKPLEGDELVKALPYIQTVQKKIVESPDGKANRIAVPIRYHYEKVDQKKGFMLVNLPRGTERTLLHDALGVQRAVGLPQTTRRRPMELVATQPIVLAGGIALWVEDTHKDGKIMVHGPSKGVFANHTDHMVIGEYLFEEDEPVLDEMQFTVRRQINCL